MARSPKPKPTPPDHNDPEAKAQIADLTREIIQLEKKRESVNADINSARKKIKALNIDMDAWAASKRRASMDPDVRAEFDRSQALCNAAMGVPIQADLFGDNSDDAGEEEVEAGGVPGTLN
jgi:multidrug resistance efflux pump